MNADFVLARPTTGPFRRARCTAIGLGLGWFLVTGTPVLAAGRGSLDEFDALAIQGDVKAGLAVLERIPPDSLGADEQTRRECILSRFKGTQLPQIQVDGLLTRDVAYIYLKYWRRCLLREVEAATANAELFDNLKVCLGKHGKEPSRFSSLDDLTEALGAMLQAEGVH